MPCDGCGTRGILTVKQLCDSCCKVVDYDPKDLKRALAYLKLLASRIEERFGDADDTM
jgi:hypothetical protein